jgi:RimJ/RimL family protein N-acetyltransferase
MPSDQTPSESAPRENAVRLEVWGKDDLPLLRQLLGDPAMTEHLGGPESEVQLVNRQARYERLAESGDNRMFKILLAATGEPVGSVGYWDSEWRGEEVYEMGWSILPAFQRRGLARAATALAIERARAVGKHRYIHAFPATDNPSSNALCRTLGFTLLGDFEGEYPPGHPMHCNDWQLDLSAGR